MNAAPPDPVEFEITINGPGLSMSQKISPQLATRIIAMVLSGGPPLTAQSVVSMDLNESTPDQLGAPPKGLREFLNEHSPKRIPEVIACIGKYLKDHRKKGAFTKTDLILLFQEAHAPIPKNLSRDVTWTVKIGWISPRSDDAGSYYVTSAGMDAVESKFPDELREKTKVSAGGRKKKLNIAGRRNGTGG